MFKSLFRPFSRIGLSQRYYASAGQTKSPLSDFNYCMDLVRTSDFDTYLSTLLVPQQIMRVAFAIRALDIELLSISRASRMDSNILNAKVLFWKEQIDKIYDFKKKQEEEGSDLKNKRLNLFEPISNELSAVIISHNLNKVWLSRLVDSRRQFLNTKQYNSLEELEKHAESACSSLYYILFDSMNIKNVDCDHAASHLGKSFLLCKVVKNILKRSNQSVYYLPTDLLMKHKIAQQDLLNMSERILRPKQQNLKDLAFEICTRANQHLNSARDLRSKVPREARGILATSILCEVFLDKIQKYDFDLMNPKMNSDFRTAIVYKLFMARIKNSY